MYMLYLLNGGGSELGFLTSPATQKWLTTENARRWLIVPFADADPTREGMWSQMERRFSHSGFELRAVVYGRDDAVAMEQAVFWAEAIYFPAGSQQLLIERLVETGMLLQIQQAVRNQQVSIIGGGSAGAMVLGQYCMYGDVGIDQVVAGLNFIPNTVIDTHLTEHGHLPRLQQVVSRYAATGVGIDERTAVVVNANNAIVDVYGAGTATVLQNGQPIILQANIPMNKPLPLGAAS